MGQGDEPDCFNALLGTSLHIKVVDVGANPIDGAPPYAAMLRAGHADIVGFEPNPSALAKLNARKGHAETYLPFAIADGRQHTLHVCRAPGMTSLLRPNHAVLRHFHGFAAWGEVLGTQDVQTARLDEVEETRGMQLLKIDIQGGELLALQNAVSRLRGTLVIQAEVEFLQMYVDQPLFADIDAFLRGAGFVFHRFFPAVSRVIGPMMVEGNIYAGLSQMLWADALFVRDFTKAHVFSDDDLLATAMIVHDCYRSYDLSLSMLSEYDRRTGKTMAGRYLSGLQSHGARRAA